VHERQVWEAKLIGEKWRALRQGFTRLGDKAGDLFRESPGTRSSMLQILTKMWMPVTTDLAMEDAAPNAAHAPAYLIQRWL
jgi:hypothetical protein